MQGEEPFGVSELVDAERQIVAPVDALAELAASSFQLAVDAVVLFDVPCSLQAAHSLGRCNVLAVAAGAKMVPTLADVDALIDAVPNEHRRSDARELCELMRSVTAEPPVMWGPNIVGFGSYHYCYDSGRTG